MARKDYDWYDEPDYDDGYDGPQDCHCGYCGKECDAKWQDVGFAHDWHGVHQTGKDMQWVSDCCGGELVEGPLEDEDAKEEP